MRVCDFRRTVGWPLIRRRGFVIAVALVLAANRSGCGPGPQSIRKVQRIITEWLGSPNGQRVFVAFWVQKLEKGPSYHCLVLFDLDTNGSFHFLPFSGDDPNALPLYFTGFTSWSADSSALFYYGGWKWDLGQGEDMDPVRYDCKSGKAVKCNQAMAQDSKMYASPSGRYALITTYVNSGQGALFLLWDTTTNTVRELLRVNEAPGCATASMCRWDGDEKKVYVTVSRRSPAGVETWQLCECSVDSKDTSRAQNRAACCLRLTTANSIGRFINPAVPWQMRLNGS